MKGILKEGAPGAAARCSCPVPVPSGMAGPGLGQSPALGPLLLIKVIAGTPGESSSEESASVQSWFPLPSSSPCAVLPGVQPALDPAPALAVGGAGVALG